MAIVRSIFDRPLIGAILRAGWVVPFVLLMGLQFAITAPTAQASSTPDQATSARQSEKFEVEWSAPKFIKLVDNKHGRILILGKAKPRTKIELQAGAVSIESQTKVHDLTKSEMNPTPKEILVGSSGRRLVIGRASQGPSPLNECRNRKDNGCVQTLVQVHESVSQLLVPTKRIEPGRVHPLLQAAFSTTRVRTVDRLK